MPSKILRGALYVRRIFNVKLLKITTMATTTKKAEAKAKVEEIFEEVKAEAKTTTEKTKDFNTSLREMKRKKNTAALTGLLVMGILLVAACCGMLAKDRESWFSKIARAIIGQGQYSIQLGCFQFESSWSADPQKKSWGFSLHKK